MRLRSVITSDDYNGPYWKLKSKLKRDFFEQRDLFSV